MATKVRTNYPAELKMPKTCVGCGAAAVQGLTRTVTKSKSSGTREHRHTTSVRVDLPLCEACHAVSGEKPAGRWISLGGTLLVLLLGWLGFAYVLPSLPEGSGLFGTLIALAVLVGLFFLARWLANRVNTSGLTPEQMARRDSVRKSAAITAWKSGGLLSKESWIEIEFERQQFAAEFAGLNNGEIM